MADFSDTHFRELHAMVAIAPEKALALIRKYQDEGMKDMKFLCAKNGWLIDIGSALNDEQLIRSAMENIEKMLAALTPEIKSLFESAMLYDLGNGYSSLARMNHELGNYFEEDSLMRKSKKALRDAIKAYEYEDKTKLADMRVNYANALSSLGRTAEAIQEYEQILMLHLDHPIAMGSLALELEQFFFISGDPYLVGDSIGLLETALKGRIEDYAGQGAREYYLKGLRRLQERQKHVEEAHGIKGKHLVPLKPKRQPKFINEYVEFCRKHDLFLSFGTLNRGRTNLRDTISAESIIVPLADEYAYPRVTRPINEIRERYATARLLLYEACEPPVDISKLTELTDYTENLDYAAYGPQVGKMKLAIESAFNILDKIAIFIKRYLEIEGSENGLYFHNVWYVEKKKEKGVHNQILDTKSNRLGGLFDIALDLRADPRLFRLQQMRHLSTHRYLLPHYEQINPKIKADGEEYHVDYFDLSKHCIESLRFARSAVIYLIAFVDEAERAKQIDGRLIAPMFTLPYKHHDIDPFMWG